MSAESTDETPPRQRGDGSRVIWQAPGSARQEQDSPFETISPGEPATPPIGYARKKQQPADQTT